MSIVCCKTVWQNHAIDAKIGHLDAVAQALYVVNTVCLRIVPLVREFSFHKSSSPWTGKSANSRVRESSIHELACTRKVQLPIW